MHGEHVDLQVNAPPTHQSSGAAKDKFANRKSREQVARVQAQASLEMAPTTQMKVIQILQGTSAQQFFFVSTCAGAARNAELPFEQLLGTPHSPPRLHIDKMDVLDRVWCKLLPIVTEGHFLYANFFNHLNELTSFGLQLTMMMLLIASQ